MTYIDGTILQKLRHTVTYAEGISLRKLRHTVNFQTFNNVVRSQVDFFYLARKHTSFGRNFYEFHSFASELSRSADVIVLSETWFSANTCRDVQGCAGFHTYSADKSGGGVSLFVRDCYTSTHVANFSVCHAYFAFKQLYRNYYWCLQTTRHIKTSRVYNKIE